MPHALRQLVELESLRAHTQVAAEVDLRTAMISTKTRPAGTERTTARDVRSLLHLRSPFRLDRKAPIAQDNLWRLAEAYVRAVGASTASLRTTSSRIESYRSSRRPPSTPMHARIFDGPSAAALRARRRRCFSRWNSPSRCGVRSSRSRIQQADLPHVVSSQHSLCFRGRDTVGSGASLELTRGGDSFGPGHHAFAIFEWMLSARTGLRLLDAGRPREKDKSSSTATTNGLASGSWKPTRSALAHDLGRPHRRRDRFVTEVVARSQGSGDAGLWWRALIDLETGAALYVRALAANVSPPVLLFCADPVTLDGAAHALTFGPGNWDAELDRYRGQLIPIEIPADEAIMGSDFVEVVEIAPRPCGHPT